MHCLFHPVNFGPAVQLYKFQCVPQRLFARGEEYPELAMSRLLCAGTMAALLIFSSAADRVAAEILVQIDRSTQTMEVTVDGAPRYNWAVSTGRPGLATPAGIFHAQRLAVTWFSRKYDNSPMPHSIFFHGGFAIHGTYETAYLGRPVSHGCVRLLPANASVLFGLVQEEGAGVTTIVVH
jgi:lipoprotein-anchoring transpeptidase ErfK/SrfK